MKWPEFNAIVDKLGGLEQCIRDGDIGTDAKKVEEVASLLTQEIIRYKFVRTKPIQRDDVTMPDLVDAVQRIIYVYYQQGWPVDGGLFGLLSWSLHTGSKERRSKQIDKSKMRVGACIEAAWQKRHGKKIAVAELARRVGVKRPTVDRWRQRHDYQRMVQMPITNESFLDILDLDTRGGHREQ